MNKATFGAMKVQVEAMWSTDGHLGNTPVIQNRMITTYLALRDNRGRAEVNEGRAVHDLRE
jgi:hypothetical protein